MHEEDLIACQECDTLHRKCELDKRSAAHCTRCGAVLYRRITDNLDRLLAITLTALITFLVAQAFPIVELETNGLSTQTTLAGAVAELWLEDMQLVAGMVLLSTIVFPLIELAALLYVVAPVRTGYRPWGFNQVLRAIQFVRPWGMIEVFMLGVLVTLVKMTSLAQVIPQASLFAFAALTLLFALLAAFDPSNMWEIAARLPQRGAPLARWRRAHTTNTPRRPRRLRWTRPTVSQR